MPHSVLFISRLGDLAGCKILAINSYSRKMVTAADHVRINAADHVRINAADHVTINEAATIASETKCTRARWLRGTNTIIRGANSRCKPLRRLVRFKFNFRYEEGSSFKNDSLE